jgi:hypothetical protein
VEGSAGPRRTSVLHLHPGLSSRPGPSRGRRQSAPGPMSEGAASGRRQALVACSVRFRAVGRTGPTGCRFRAPPVGGRWIDGLGVEQRRRTGDAVDQAGARVGGRPLRRRPTLVLGAARPGKLRGGRGTTGSGVCRRLTARLGNPVVCWAPVGLIEVQASTPARSHVGRSRRREPDQDEGTPSRLARDHAPDAKGCRVKPPGPRAGRAEAGRPHASVGDPLSRVLPAGATSPGVRAVRPVRFARLLVRRDVHVVVVVLGVVAAVLHPRPLA